eukprot:CAMPEP_0172488676 /NCGR_PEP_ID=MMETSP1066-20121228/18321_1 /TAXON_ID=671091 /ORGANISM="Coscinodiscus wailesii, Strain CCMP2513" /LENGTH=56 /DNA_ID=CAMNT_0013256049 /DNA_START=80 /DNA_END=246 /DNA_ORIENTATION=+
MMSFTLIMPFLMICNPTNAVTNLRGTIDDLELSLESLENENENEMFWERELGGSHR